MKYRRIWCVGETGSGKSRLLTFLAAQTAQDGETVWALDVLDCMPIASGVQRAVPDEDADLESAGPYYDWGNRWAAAAFEECRSTGRPMLLVIDETDLLCRRGEAPPALVRCIMQGRKYGLSYALATRRPVEIPPQLRSQADEIYCFRLREPRDIEAVAQRGLSSEDLQRLPTGAFYHRSLALGWHYHRDCFERCEALRSG